ncbi:MAG: flagellar hook-length control protein FliK, partial [Candidatus Binatia bacterium]
MALASPSAPADIYVWHDAGGAEHYTNSLDGVPEERRSDATLFVRERPRAAPEPTPEPSPEAAPAAPIAEDEA